MNGCKLSGFQFVHFTIRPNPGCGEGVIGLRLWDVSFRGRQWPRAVCNESQTGLDTSKAASPALQAGFRRKLFASKRGFVDQHRTKSFPGFGFSRGESSECFRCRSDESLCGVSVASRPSPTVSVGVPVPFCCGFKTFSMRHPIRGCGSGFVCVSLCSAPLGTRECRLNINQAS